MSLRLLTLAAAATAAIAPVAMAEGMDVVPGVGIEYTRAPGVEFGHADGDGVLDVVLVTTGDARATADLDTGGARPTATVGAREIALGYSGPAADDAFLTPDAGVSVRRDGGQFVVTILNPSSRDLEAADHGPVGAVTSSEGSREFAVGARDICERTHPCMPRSVPNVVVDAVVPDTIATVNAPALDPFEAAPSVGAETLHAPATTPAPGFAVADAQVPALGAEAAPVEAARAPPGGPPVVASAPPTLSSAAAPAPPPAAAWVRGTVLVAGSLALAVPILAWLFNRLHSPGAYLEDPSRARVYEVIQDKPGLTASDVARLTGVHRTTAEYHARRLQQAGYVSTVREGGVNRYFASAVGGDGALRVAVCLVRYEPLRRILEWLSSEHAAPPRDLAAALAVSRRAVRYHLQRLTEAGLVARVPDARLGEVLRLTELGRRALAVAAPPATGAAPAAQGLSAPLP